MNSQSFKFGHVLPKELQRNTIVKHHYEKLGFTKLHESSEAEQWELTIADYAFKALPMQFIYPT